MTNRPTSSSAKLAIRYSIPGIAMRNPRAEYISPEIIKGVPYNHSVDWWSFG